MATYQSKHTGAEIDAGIDAANAALTKSGGTMTGALILHADPTNNRGAATKQYVDDSIENITITSGTDGVGIVSIEKTGTSGLVDTYTITLTNGNTYTFTVTNGADGSGGDGSGDMLKSVYDSDGDNVVDNAKKLDGQTAAYYATANHTHALTADVITGILPVTKGGTGASTRVSARKNLGFTYSTTEQATGDTWIDGKPIYCTVSVIDSFDLAKGSNKSQILADYSGTNIDTLIDYRVYLDRGVYFFDTFYLNTSFFWSVRMTDAFSLELRYTNTSQDETFNGARVILYYTKTTD